MRSICVGVATALLLAGPAWAHGDEDHGAAASAAAAAPRPLTPRMEAATDLFELVAALRGSELVIHLDRYATNEPVTGARISVEGGPLKAAAAVERDGAYRVPAAALAAPGTHPLVFTVQAGEANDLLTGELLVAGTAVTEAHAHGMDWQSLATPAWAAGAAVLVLGIGVFAWRRRKAVSFGGVQ